MKSVRRAAAVLAGLIVASILAAVAAGGFLSAPVRRSVGAPPTGMEAVAFEGAPQELVSGWFGRGQPGRGAVLLLHGVRGDRQQRAPGERIAVIGVSLGAASFVLASGSVKADAVVLESMYPTIEEAVADRLSMRLGAIGKKLAPALLWQLPFWLGIDADQLRPIDHLAALHAPVLIAAGTRDEHTTQAETRRLFAAASEPKELWLVDGAAHVDLYAFDKPAYEKKISAFLEKNLAP